MKLGYNQATGMGCSTLEQDLALCEECGFDFIEIRLDMLGEYLKAHTAQELQAFFEASRLKPYSMNALYTYEEMFSSQDDPRRLGELLELFDLGCRVGQAIGCGNFIIVPPFGQGPWRKGWEETRRDCVRIFRELAERAKPFGMRLCLELVGAPHSSVRSVAQADEIVREVDRENVGFVFDSANLYMNGKLKDFGDMATVDKEKIFAVHINDFSDVPVELFSKEQRCFCGEGVIDLENYLSTLKKIGYDGMVSIETFRQEYWEKSPRWVIQTAFDTTENIMRTCGCL